VAGVTNKRAGHCSGRAPIQVGAVASRKKLHR
jgi:hypothetical protein